LVVLRLTRTGKKKQAHYRVVVADSRRFVNSKYIAIVGWYNPHTKECELKKDEIATWLEKGAQPSNTVAKLLKANGVKLPDWVKIAEKVSKPKKEPAKSGEPAESIAKPEKVEAPQEESAEAETEPTEEEVPAEEAPVEVLEVPDPSADAQDDTEVPEETTTEETEKNPE